LLGGTGLILYFFGRYDWLGWGDPETNPVQFRPVSEVAVTPAQRAVVWFLFIASLLSTMAMAMSSTIVSGPWPARSRPAITAMKMPVAR
jgi:hypothetical protein